MEAALLTCLGILKRFHRKACIELFSSFPKMLMFDGLKLDAWPLFELWPRIGWYCDTCRSRLHWHSCDQLIVLIVFYARRWPWPMVIHLPASHLGFVALTCLGTIKKRSPVHVDLFFGVELLCGTECTMSPDARSQLPISTFEPTKCFPWSYFAFASASWRHLLLPSWRQTVRRDFLKTSGEAWRMETCSSQLSAFQVDAFGACSPRWVA